MQPLTTEQLADMPAKRLYALVCGLQYERAFGRELSYDKETVLPLFKTFPDTQIAWAGPWLINIAEAPEREDELIQLEQQFPAVSWLETRTDFSVMAGHLASLLNIRLDDGQVALFRYYDPGVLHSINTLLSEEQRAHFLTGIEQWHYRHNGERFTLTPFDTVQEKR